MAILFEELGWSTWRWRQRLRAASYRIFYTLVAFLLRQRKPFIVASCFGRKHPRVHARLFRILQRSTRCRPIQVHCWATPPVLTRRHLRRSRRGERHPGFADSQKDAQTFQRLVLKYQFGPLAIGGALIEVDTSGHWAVDRPAVLRKIIRAARR